MSNPLNPMLLILIFAVLTINCQIVELSDYEYPLPSDSARYETIAIIGTNDIHGRVVPSPEIYAGANKSAKSGGLTLLSSYLDILSSQWGNKLLWLDGGDQFQGSLESNLFKGKPLVDFFNYKSKIQIFKILIYIRILI